MTRNATSAEEKLDRLSKRKSKLLELLVQEKSRQAQKIKPCTRIDDSRQIALPVSSAQQRLWFINQMEGVGAAYNIPAVLQLSGSLDQHALRRALDALVQRHEVLRTVFVSVEGEPMQVIATHREFNLTEIDLSECSKAECQARVEFHKTEEAQSPFDLGAGPLIRGRLLRLRSDEYVLLITMHHIVSDGWSMSVLIPEFAVLYSAYRQGQDDPLKPLPIQYADYAQWQRQSLEGRIFDKQLSYWRAHLEGAAPELKLPADRPRPPVHSYCGDNISLVLDARLTAELKAIARVHGMTLFMVLYAGWTILLSRLSGQSDIVIGTPVANRRQPELEGLIGFFVNTLVLRAEVDGDTPLSNFLERIKGVTLGAYDHQDIPFEQIVEALHPQRSLSRNPIFQVMFALQNAPINKPRLPGLTVNLERIETQFAKFDLLLELEEQGDEIIGSVNYSTDLFDRGTVERWIACFMVLLREMIHGEKSCIRDLPILPASERRHVIESFNTTQVAYPHEKTIHELFELHVFNAPEAIALAFEEQQLTYAQLNHRANQLAHFLRRQGIVPDCLVGLCVERGPDMIVAILAILKAGGAYVPLDPSYPYDRLAYMLEDASPAVLLTQEWLKKTLPEANARVVALDSEWDTIAQHEAGNPIPHLVSLRSHHLAYVIYTSGSTGRPKGVMIEHQGVCNLAAMHSRLLGVQSGDRILQFASMSFDACVWEWVMALCTGACLCLATQEELTPGEPLRNTLEAQRITHATLPPVCLGALASNKGLEELQTLIVAGEACSATLVDKWAQGRRFINAYGPTESTVCATMHVCDSWSAASPPIGRPISNIQIYILDSRRQPVPIGVAGEIYIGGVGVARGYLNRPELTTERFVANPFTDDPRIRIYRTGDLGRWRSDGTVEYLGRNDHQVKIRGFRIELGEIEALLSRHARVKEAVIVAREDASAEKRLVAYVVPDETSGISVAPSLEELRTHLRSKLPEYMVPSAFVLLDRLPLTPNGKLDRLALPAPELGAYTSREFEAPRGEVEEILAGVWQTLLCKQRVGRQDNFFELGGHSLLIVQMMERLRRVGLSAKLRHVFESPTLADLASALTNEAVGNFDVPPNKIPAGCRAITSQMLPLVQLEPVHINRIVESVPGGAANILDIYPLAPLQEGILFHHLLDEGRGDTYVLPIVLSVSSRERLQELISALQAVIDRHDILRTAVLWEQLPQPLQVVYRQVAIPVQQIELDSDRDPIEQVNEWIMPGKQRLDLRQAPLMRLQVAPDPSGTQWYALLQLHHIAADHVGLEMVISEAVAYLEGRAQRLPELASYRSHVAQALAHARTHNYENFFREKLGEVDEPTAPFGLLDVHGDGTQIEEVYEELDSVLARRVRTEARRLCVSSATLFHAAWAVVVALTSGRNDVVFGTVLLGRLHGSAGAQRALGMFINTLPLRLQLKGMTAKELVEKTQRELVDLLNHEQASLAMAQRCSGIVGSAPLFTALLNYRHSVPNAEAQWASAQGIEMLAIQERTNYPVTLSVDDLGEGFALKAQIDRRINPRRMTGYMHMAVHALTTALEEAPQTAALSLSILPEAERRRVIHSFNATRTACGHEKLVHEMFEDQARRTPHAVAVEYEGNTLTYAGLNRKANQLARSLRYHGVGVDRLVGICVERSIEMVVGILGILKAGGAYVPLDPNYPADRLQYMLADSVPQIVLTQKKLRETIPLIQVKCIELEEELGKIDNGADENLSLAEFGLAPQNLVYVIYTSGSTGQPKGTAMSHRAMVNLIEWQRYNLRSNGKEHVLQFAALSFDVAFQEIFTTLCVGNTLVMLDEWIRRDAQALLGFLCRHSIERLFVPPLMLQSLAECASSALMLPEKLRDVITAGEQLRITPEIVHFFRGLPGCRLHNHYGPTETHVVTALTLTGDPAEWPALPSIGKPISNTQMYVLNGQRQPVPIGVPGEIYIGGTGVAQGYLNRPELTAARFVADPFRTESPVFMYRTGDLGTWRDDGTLMYMGRNDFQVKIRGYRIELGEIEGQLARHEKVKDVAVIEREDIQGEKRLVAYVTRRGETNLVTEELRAHLKAVLPEYMVPGAFVILGNLPLTPSGKLDRRALPVPELGAYASFQYESPQGVIEKTLAEIWQEVLQVGRVGRHDSFFELGGHSLLALKALVKINQALDSTLRVKDVYVSPTLSELAARISGGMTEDEFVVLSREATLDADIVSIPGTVRVPTKAVLLTGGTGFVGRFLLAQLLQDTDATLYCLVRASSADEAMARLRTTLSNWDLWRDEFEQRIVGVPGDLRLPHLGISEGTYESLSESVDSIYHCATSMNHLETYAMAKAANVDASRELVKLATHRKTKLINYISTLGVFSSAATDAVRIVNEESPIDYEKHLSSHGYMASKWVGEKIFMIAGDRGIPCNIFRLGLVWADTQRGRFDELQHVYRIMKTCLLSGYGIDDYRFPMPPTPVDYVARSIVFLGNRHSEGRGIFHISSSTQTIENVFKRCNEIAGASLELKSFYEWVGEVKRLHQNGRPLPAVPLWEFAFSMNEESFHEHQRGLRSAVNVRFDLTRTHRELERAGIVAPVFGDELLKLCLESMFCRDVEVREWMES